MFENEIIDEQTQSENENDSNIYTVEELSINILCTSQAPNMGFKDAIKGKIKNSRYGMKHGGRFIEFGEQPDFSVEFLIKKWRNLRDTDVRLKGEYEAYTPSGSGAKKRKKQWEYFEIMGFLNETLNYRA